MNFVYTWCLVRLEESKREEWEAMLVAPLDPSKPTRATPAQVEEEGASFMALMGQDMQGKSGV